MPGSKASLRPSTEKHVSPELTQLDLEDNYLTDEACAALEGCDFGGHLVAHELWLAGMRLSRRREGER